MHPPPPSFQATIERILISILLLTQKALINHGDVNQFEEMVVCDGEDIRSSDSVGGLDVRGLEVVEVLQ